jgi:hypothetical protein
MSSKIPIHQLVIRDFALQKILSCCIHILPWKEGTIKAMPYAIAILDIEQ